MKTYGKILFFNQNDGKGIIITSEKQKIDFDIKDWDDFDVMPFPGLEVVFNFSDGDVSNLLSNKDEKVEAKIEVEVEVQEEVENEPYTQEELENITLEELIEIASEDFQIDDASEMHRPALIEAILEIQDEEKAEVEPYTQEELENITLDELKEIAFEDFQIDDVEEMHRPALIEAILEIQDEEKAKHEPYTQEELEDITLEELREVASEDFKIDDVAEMHRPALIEAILEIQDKEKIEPEKYKQEELEDIILEELKKIAFENFQIDNASEMHRPELIEAILEIQNKNIENTTSEDFQSNNTSDTQETPSSETATKADKKKLNIDETAEENKDTTKKKIADIATLQEQAVSYQLAP